MYVLRKRFAQGDAEVLKSRPYKHPVKVITEHHRRPRSATARSSSRTGTSTGRRSRSTTSSTCHTRPETGLFDELRAAGVHVLNVGDSVRPRNLYHAVKEGSGVRPGGRRAPAVQPERRDPQRPADRRARPADPRGGPVLHDQADGGAGGRRRSADPGRRPEPAAQAVSADQRSSLPPRMTGGPAGRRRARRGRPAGRRDPAAVRRRPAAPAGCGSRPPRRRAAAPRRRRRCGPPMSRAITRAGQGVRAGERDAAAHDLDLEAADAAAPVAHPGEREASLTRSSRSAGLVRVMIGQSDGWTWIAVGDELDVDRVVVQRRDRDPRRTVLDAGHRVEEVRRRPGAGRVARPGPRRGSPPSGRATVATPRSREPADEVEAAGQLRRDR